MKCRRYFCSVLTATNGTGCPSPSNTFYINAWSYIKHVCRLLEVCATYLTIPGSDDSNLSAIIGGAVGGITLLLLIDTILCLIWLKRQSDGEDDYIITYTTYAFKVVVIQSVQFDVRD